MNEETSSSDKAWMEAVDEQRAGSAPRINYGPDPKILIIDDGIMPELPKLDIKVAEIIVKKESAKMQDNQQQPGVRQEMDVETVKLEDGSDVKIKWDGFHYRAYDKDGKQIGQPRVALNEMHHQFPGKVIGAQGEGALDKNPAVEPPMSPAEQEGEKDAQAVESDVDTPPDPAGPPVGG